MAHGTFWKSGKPLVGVIHLLPLPGSPEWGGRMEPVLERAVEEAGILEAGGFDGLLVENFQDAPFYPGAVPPETVSAMTLAVSRIRQAVEIPVGINVLRNDADAALSVAVVTGAGFIRVNVHTGSMFTDQGLLQGEAHRTLRKRRALGASVSILADVLVKHATPPPGSVLETAARDAWFRGRADGIILTGTETGARVDVDEIRRVREALPSRGRIWVGSGATPETVEGLLQVADGIIVGSALQDQGRAGGGILPERVADFISAAKRN